MKILKVHSLPIDLVMKDLAAALNTVYICECDEYHINIPPEYGEGVIYGIMFDSGFGMINYEVKFNMEIEIHFVQNNVHPVKCIFCYEGELTHKFITDDSEPHFIVKYRNAIVASKDVSGHMLIFPANQRICVNSIEVNRSEFIKKFECHYKNLPESLHRLFTDVKAVQDFFYIRDYSLQISDIITHIRDFKNNNLVRRIYIESKAYELFVFQINQFIDDQQDAPDREIIRAAEIEIVKSAAVILKENLDTYITIKDLSARLGMNEAKLQRGFQYLYGKTINQFISDYRLEQAVILILSPENNISEVARMIGINTNSYFSKIFKEKYGITPKAFQVKYLKGKKQNSQ